MADDIFLGNIIKSTKIRGILYDAGQALGYGLLLCNAGVVYMFSQSAIHQYPLWLGTATAVYAAGAPYVFGIAKSNLPTSQFSTPPAPEPTAPAVEPLNPEVPDTTL
jgi:hypothetical protein